MKTVLRSCLLCILVSTITGCATIQLHSNNDTPLQAYAGTQLAWQRTQKYWHHYDFYGQVVFFAMDVPLCAIADTVLLPVDIFRGLRPQASRNNE